MGINNRDLRTFQTDLEHTLRLRAADSRPIAMVVGESGIRTRARRRCGWRRPASHAMLVGETLMARPDIGAAVDELLGARG